MIMFVKTKYSLEIIIITWTSNKITISLIKLNAQEQLTFCASEMW